LEYFTEFLEDPSVPDINEFFRILRRWIKYIEAHKDEFNYLADDEWKEVRERLIAELDIRVDIKDDLEFEFDEINGEFEKIPEGDFDKSLELFNRRLEFMKTYKYVFDFSDEVINEFEEKIIDYAKGLEAARQADENVRIKQMELDIAIAALDDDLAKHYERTGKVPVLPSYPDKKVYKGN